MNVFNAELNRIRIMWGIPKGVTIVFSGINIIPIGCNLPCGYPLNDNEAIR